MAVATCTAQQVTQAPKPSEESPTFQTQSRLVLLPFHATRGKQIVTDLDRSDIALLEDGKPREFTIFDTPSSEDRLPLEIVLLFDTNPKINYLWDPIDVFRFVPQWDETMSRKMLLEERYELRFSVYRCTGKALYRLAPATADSAVLTDALRGILTRQPARPEPGTAIALSLPPQRKNVNPGRYTDDFPTSPFISAEQRGWPMEAAIAALDDVSARQDKVARVLIMFSEGIGATTTIPEDVANHALDLGIPVYPIATNFQNHVQQDYPRNFFRMHQFEAVGKMTGGRSEELTFVDAAILQRIVESVKRDGLAQYVVGFSPEATGGSPKQHNLEVHLNLTNGGGAVEGGKRRAVY
jgi:VWFA-related protein